MDSTLRQLLAEMQTGTLSVAAATERVARLLDQAPEPHRYAQQLRSEIARAHLEPTLARALATILAEFSTDTLQREPPASDETQLRAAPTADETLLHAVPSSDETRMRPATTADETALHAAPTSDETQIRAAPTSYEAQPQESLTQMRPAEIDETRMRTGTPTAALGAPTLSDHDASRGESFSSTGGSNSQRAPFTKTLTDETPGQSAYARTLKSSDETEVIPNRLARSHEDTQELRTEDLRPGSVIKKRFVLDTLLGRGGMGLVFGAIDRRKEEAADPNPRVALKVLNADFQRHPQSLMALQREARKAQTLAHPNVVTVFDFDRDGSVIYMTMELLKGRPLEALVKEARGKGVGRDTALPIIRGIAEGLAYAHRKGIVHSDLKPGNIFLGADGTPKILDFGIARAVPSADAEQEVDIFDAGMLGAYTEAYATDEMVEGKDPHPADDMYSLGIIAYELLTGSHPYQRHSAPGARSLGIKYPPLKGLRLREARAIDRCLSFDRRTRPQSAGEFLKSFRGVTALQKASFAAVAMLAVASGYLWYQNRVEAGPAIAFDKLPLRVQSDFKEAMANGNEAWKFWLGEHNEQALNDSIRYFSEAYGFHPRNREAVKVLQMAADAQLALTEDVPLRHKIACDLQHTSDYFRKYPPVLKAVEEGQLECPAIN